MPLIIKDEYPEKLFREDGKRLDGRDKHELRPIKMEVGVLGNADGSAYLEWGNNKIYAAVYGPREVHPHHLAKPDGKLTTDTHDPSDCHSSFLICANCATIL